MKTTLINVMPLKMLFVAAALALAMIGPTGSQVCGSEAQPWRCEFCHSLVWPEGRIPLGPPMTILNPFVEQTGWKVEPPVVVSDAPVTIINPFFKNDGQNK